MQPLAYFFMLMRGIIINDNMEFFALFRLIFNLLEKVEKLFMGMLLVTLTGHVTGGNFKCCKQGTGAVSFIIMRDGSSTPFL